MCYAILMILYYTSYAPIQDRSALAALMPPARRARFEVEAETPGPLLAYTLLAWALERHYSIAAREAIAFTSLGRPYVPGGAVHLSLSHSKTHALCTLADFPVGCDIEAHRPVSKQAKRRVLGTCEAPENFFAHWTLKESLFKLCGDYDQPFSALTFSLLGDRAHGQGAYGWLYREIPGSTAAVVAGEPFPRPLLTPLAPETLFSYATEKWA